MVVKIHFETLAPGLQAKLDARYRAHNNYSPGTRKLDVNGYNTGLLEDAIGRYRPTLTGRNK